MPMLDRAGRFKAQVIECGLQQSQQEGSGAIQWAAKYAISQMLNPENNEWQDVSEQGWSIQGWQNVVKKDGDLNLRAIENLKAALGWDATSFDPLDDPAFCGAQLLQITVEMENDLKGQARLVVKWVNPENFEGVQLSKIDANAIKGLNSRFGAKLRALSPAPTAGKSLAAGKPGVKPLPAKPVPQKQY